MWEENIGTEAPPPITKTLSQPDLLNFFRYVATEFNLERFSDSLVKGHIIG